MIVTVGGAKGGTGKTTITTNLIAMRTIKGNDCLLIDTNYQQNSASNWCSMRDETKKAPRIVCMQKYDKNINDDLITLKNKWDDIFVDCGGYDDVAFRSALTVSDIFISPVQPAQYDVWTLPRIEKIVNEVKIINPSLKAYFLISRAPTNPAIPEENETVSFINECNFENMQLLEPVIHERRVFRKVVPDGLAVIEFLPADEKANSELNKLFNVIFREKL